MDSRPVNLDLRTIKFPVTAYASILHRMSGMFLFICIPFLLFALQTSLKSAEDYRVLQDLGQSHLYKFCVFSLLSAFVYHCLAGVRHLLMDCHLGESIKFGKISAALVIGLSIIFAAGFGVYLWVL